MYIVTFETLFDFWRVSFLCDQDVALCLYHALAVFTSKLNCFKSYFSETKKKKKKRKKKQIWHVRERQRGEIESGP